MSILQWHGHLNRENNPPSKLWTGQPAPPLLLGFPTFPINAAANIFRFQSVPVVFTLVVIIVIISTVRNAQETIT